MKYIVIKPFRDISGFKMPGESIELDDTRAAKLRIMGLIGGRIERAVKVEPDTMVDKAKKAEKVK